MLYGVTCKLYTDVMIVYWWSCTINVLNFRSGSTLSYLCLDSPLLTLHSQDPASQAHHKWLVKYPSVPGGQWYDPPLLTLLLYVSCTWLSLLTVYVLILLLSLSLLLNLLVNLLNLFTCMSLTMINLDSFTLLMNSVHFNCVVGVVTKENNLDLLMAILPPLSSRMVLMLLTLFLK